MNSFVFIFEYNIEHCTNYLEDNYKNFYTVNLSFSTPLELLNWFKKINISSYDIVEQFIEKKYGKDIVEYFKLKPDYRSIKDKNESIFHEIMFHMQVSANIILVDFYYDYYKYLYTNKQY